MDTIDITPTAEGYANIARTFAASMLSDVKASRREDAAHVLDSLLEIVAYLATIDPALVRAVRADIVR